MNNSGTSDTAPDAVLHDNFRKMLEAATKQLQAAMTRIVELEQRLEHVGGQVAQPVAAGGARWEWMTICDDPRSVHREDGRIAEALNDGWAIDSIQYGQSAIMCDGVLDVVRTRVVNLRRMVEVPAAPIQPKEEGKEAPLSELADDGGDTSSPYEETVIEAEGEAVVAVALGANMCIVDALPEELVVERAEVAGMSYREALRNPWTTAEDLAAIRMRECREAGDRARADYAQKVQEWAEKWKAAPMPFEVPQPVWVRG